MLVEPPEDPVRLALDRALAKAVRARLAGGPRPSPDADAIALRSLLKGLTPPEVAALRSVLGRIDAGHGAPLIVWGPASQVIAADRYGLVARIAAKPEAALTAARGDGRALMDLTAASAWWGRLLAEPELRVVAALPDNGAGRPRALMVQRTPSGPTGDDRTFWVTDSPLTPGRIVAALEAAGLTADPLIEAGGLKLFALAGYVQATDGRLSEAPGSLKGVIGAAPVF